MTSELEKFTRDAIAARSRVAYGAILTRPVLRATDGASLLWVADVKVASYAGPALLLNGSMDELKEVPIASGNRELFFAEVGAAVQLQRNMGGRWEIVGFAERRPGRHIRVAVDLSALTSGTAEDVTLSSRVLTYGELSTLGGGYGVARYGVIGIFRGGELIELRSG